MAEDNEEAVPQVVTNKGRNPISFPGGETIQPGQSGEIADWNQAQKSKVVQAWINEGTVVEGDVNVNVGGTHTTDEDEEDA